MRTRRICRKVITITSPIFLAFLFFGGVSLAPRFPEMKMTTLEGQNVNAAYFKKSNTVVVHFFIGCHAAMLAVKDLQDLQRQGELNFQILYIAQNTPAHVDNFNSEEDNTWSKIRKYYQIEALTGDVVAICKSEDVTFDGDNTIIGEHCNTFAKSIKTKVSPTFLYVDRGMKVRKKEKGYRTVSDPSELRGRIVRNFK